MNLTELERRAIKELMDDVEQRLKLETRNLENARFQLTKLQIRVKLFGEETLDDSEREAFVQACPEDIAKHEAEVARLQMQIDKLRAYEQE
jgi:hypothetical protein